MIIDCESATVADVLQSLAAMCTEAGAAVDPHVRIVERGGHLSVHSSLTPESPSPVVVSIPSEILIPTIDLQWRPGPELSVSGGTENLTPLQRDVLDLQIALYNAAHKLPTLTAVAPKLNFAPESPAARALADVRPWFRTDHTAAQALISSRTLGVKAANDENQPMLIPLLELFNHHRKGAGFASSTHIVSLRQAKPTGTSECFASYGSRRDCLDLALNYNYFDPEPALAKCAPMTLPIEALGALRINGLEAARVSRLNPPKVWRKDGALVINHITFDAAHPDRIWATVGLALQSAFLQAGVSDARGATRDTFDNLATETIRRHQVVIACLTHDSSPAANLVRAACERQIDIINRAIIA